MTPSQALEALLLETIPTRPSRAPAARMDNGPTEQWRRLGVEREKWRALSEVATAADDELKETA